MSDVFNLEKTGVSLFKSSTGSEDTPFFESDEEVYLNNDVDFTCTVDYGDEWKSLTLATDITGSAIVGAKNNGIQYKVDGDHVFICGCVAYTASGAGAKALTVGSSLPTNLHPATKIFRLAPHNGTNVAFIELFEDGTVYVARDYTMGNTSPQTPTITYIDIWIDYFVSHV